MLPRQSMLGVHALATSLLYLADRPAAGKGVLQRPMLRAVNSNFELLTSNFSRFDDRAMHEAAMGDIDSLDA
jgi:hypothetical protein